MSSIINFEIDKEQRHNDIFIYFIGINLFRAMCIRGGGKLDDKYLSSVAPSSNPLNCTEAEDIDEDQVFEVGGGEEVENDDYEISISNGSLQRPLVRFG